MDTGRRWWEEKLVTKVVEEEEEGVVKRVTIMVLARIWEYPILTTWEEQEIEWMEVNGRDVTLVREMLITL